MRDILIVEDGLHERDRLEKLFRGANYTVSAIETVSEAENLLRLEQFRLVVLDIGLADKSGSYLFEVIKRSKRVPFIIVLTGNPSVHLKQRFIDQGAVDYIVKASAAAENEAILERVRGLLGSAESEPTLGVPLMDFLSLCVGQSSHDLFLDESGDVPPCEECGSSEFIVSFSHKVQLPPIIEGRIICSGCKREMDPEVGS